MGRQWKELEAGDIKGIKGRKGKGEIMNNILIVVGVET